mgnify:CR=1 FL=1
MIVDDPKEKIYDEPTSAQLLVREKKDCSNELDTTVIELLDKSPQAYAMYIFYNKSFDKIKILFWHKNGFVLFYKRLEKGKFRFPKKTDVQLSINKKQFSWLVAGLDFMLMDEFKELNFDDYC